MDIEKEYNKWLTAVKDEELLNELKSLNTKEIEDSFYRELEFGTGGLRGIIGVGTNKLNVYTVGKASQGLADYINTNFDKPSIAISYDSRIKSKVFAETAAAVFAANNISVYIYPCLMPTPCLSYAVRYFHCSAGVMITASHNPSKYNGYKVYGSDGCQITDEAAKAITSFIEKVDIFNDVKVDSFENGKQKGLIKYIGNNVAKSFTKEVLKCDVLYGDEVDHDIKVIYTPLNGTGLVPVLDMLQEANFKNIIVVEEQKNPDGNFPTCPYPNPEIPEAMELGIKYAKINKGDILLATDPDCDRVGVAIPKPNGEYRLLTGNEVGLLLLDFICLQMNKHNKLPNNPYCVKTIVTIDMSEKIAKQYGVKVKNVLTGFKYIGEQIGKDEDNFVFGFEDSCGYLNGTYVRDKDGVNGCFLIVEMAAYYKKRDISLYSKLMEIYDKFGFYKNSLYTFTFEGKDGMPKMKALMDSFRNECKEVSSFKVVDKTDYINGLEGLPKSNVVKLLLDNGSSVVMRPSGTEPKLKAYLSMKGGSLDEAARYEQMVVNSLNSIIKSDS